ncbi:M12 family metallo-peptidase [Nocardioides sp.]|uniref:M12 family metallo-peptidase n=1 Tax=Nocardioides sp. TaxID=35761 RepID=UPI0026336A0F|nr:M12 family metallo-peptidase [Nocardioides sp.]MCW2737470.1 Metallo-peptidase family [Nocardioides sp.]
MSVRPSVPALLGRATLVAALGVTAMVSSGSAEAQPPSAHAITCADTSLSEPAPLGTALDSGVSVAAVREQNDLTAGELGRLAADGTSWLDECGQVFVVDRAVPERRQDTTDAVAAADVPADVFDLSSRPASTRTVYLDFDGATYSGTSWQGGAEIVSPAYSLDADRASFSDTERAQIYLAWKVVSEDFAAFDVNVTTRRPDPSAITRTSASDPTYGVPVVITPTNSVGSGCSCGGEAYVGVFASVAATGYQPAWIFTDGSGTVGDNVGQVISHEVGHTFGLSHDGTSHTSYYSGAEGWGPIMGASYGRRAAHWSRGEYADANNTEDDVAIIARSAPTVPDDHSDGPAGATPIAAGVPTTGTIASRTDTDAFSFTVSGAATLTVAGPSGYSNLDAQLTIHDAAGTVVATVDPTADTASDASMAATWTVTPSATATTYTAVVDGVGSGTPSQAGRYSDYGSFGAYTITLATGTTTVATPTSIPTPTPTTTPTPTPTPTPTTTATVAIVPTTTPTTTQVTTTAARMTFVTSRLPRARVRKAYRAVIAFTGPVSEARVVRWLPRGLTWRVVGHSIVIRGTALRASTRTVATVLSGEGSTIRHRFRLVVR